MKKVRGTKDIFAPEIDLWHHVEEKIRRICRDFSFYEMRTPVFEYTELFQRGVGDSTDIVQKEMYTFLDKGERSITLRPENTASCARAYVENKLYADTQPQKMYYVGPMFRYENPQAGRQRQFHQFGVEMYGSYEAEADAQVIALAAEFFNCCGIKNTTLYINSLGCPDCRKEYLAALQQYLTKHEAVLCPTCRDRMAHNPLRVLDCKVKTCQEVVKDAPSVLDTLDADCKKHFEALKSFLDVMEIDYTVDPRIVRGLDYYTRTVFEFVSEGIGAQSTICGGGRYNHLIEECGGAPTGGVGFAIGLERLLMVMAQSGAPKPAVEPVAIYIGGLGEKGRKKAMALTNQLRRQHIKAECDMLAKSVKAQLKYADKIGACYSMVIGENELETGKAALRNMGDGSQEEVSFSALAEILLDKGV